MTDETGAPVPPAVTPPPTPATPSPAPPTPPAVAIPTAQMREILAGLRAAEAEAPRTHALHWLVFQEYQHIPLIWQFTWQEAWHVHAKVALMGLLQLAVEQGRVSPDILMGIAGALANFFGAHEAAVRTWNRFLQMMPAARQEPTVRNFNERMRALVELHQKLNRPAVQVHRTIMQMVPAPAADMQA